MYSRFSASHGDFTVITGHVIFYFIMHTIKAISCFSYNGYIKHFFVSSTSATLKRQAAKHTSTTKRLRYLKPQGPRLVQRYDSSPFQQQKKRVSTPFRRIQNSLIFFKTPFAPFSHYL